MHLVIVRRGRLGTFKMLSDSLAREEYVQIMWDRRAAERRRQAETPLVERRCSERRRGGSLNGAADFLVATIKPRESTAA